MGIWGGANRGGVLTVGVDVVICVGAGVDVCGS